MEAWREVLESGEWEQVGEGEEEGWVERVILEVTKVWKGD